MKKLAAISLAALTAFATSNAFAFFDSKNKWEEPECWYNPHDCNPYDEWDPRYWMEEMSQMWEDDDDYYGGYGMPMMPYGGGGYGMPRPPMPYGGAPYGAPQMPGAGPQMPGAGPQMPGAGPQMAPRPPMPYPYQPRPPMPAPTK